MRIQAQLFWPCITRDVKQYVRWCNICQKIGKRGFFGLALKQHTALSSHPWYKITIDLVGIILPPSAHGHRFILTIIDDCSLYVKAVPLKFITAEDIADALLLVFCHIGSPNVIISLTIEHNLCRGQCDLSKDMLGID